MLDKTKFFEKKKRCPVCNKKLSLFLCIDYVGTFQSQSFKGQDENAFHFKPLKDEKFNLSTRVSTEDFIEIKLIDDVKFSISISSESLFREIEKQHLRFFYLCNENSIKTNEGFYNSINNYEFLTYDVCYFKVANDLLFKNVNDAYLLSFDPPKNSTTGIEVLSISKNYEEISKHYCLVYDFNEDKTKFYFITSDNNSIVEFNDNQFVKDIPILNYYPDFKDKEKIISKLDSWILLS